MSSERAATARRPYRGGAGPAAGRAARASTKVRPSPRQRAVYRRRRLFVSGLLVLVVVLARWHPSIVARRAEASVGPIVRALRAPSMTAQLLSRDLALAAAVSPLRGRIVRPTRHLLQQVQRLLGVWHQRLRERQPGRAVVRRFCRLGLARGGRSRRLPVHKRRPQLLFSQFLRVGRGQRHVACHRDGLRTAARGCGRLRAGPRGAYRPARCHCHNGRFRGQRPGHDQWGRGPHRLQHCRDWPRPGPSRCPGKEPGSPVRLCLAGMRRRRIRKGPLLVEPELG